MTGDNLSTGAIDRDRRLWVGGSAGCFRSRTPVDNGAELKFDFLDIPGIPARTAARSLFVEESGVVWIATSRGLARFDNGRWKVFTTKDGLKDGDLESITQGHGSLWLAYRDALGVTRLRYEGNHLEIEHFTMRNGLASDEVYGLALDGAGRLWAGTDNGIDVYDQSRWRHYGKEDGLIWDDTDSSAVYADPDGSMWIGTSNGLSRYLAPPYPIPEVSSPVVLTLIEGESHKYNPEDHPELLFSQRSLLIRYASLSYQSETRTRFRYRLAGYDNTWRETGERSVRFAGLPAGS